MNRLSLAQSMMLAAGAAHGQPSTVVVTLNVQDFACFLNKFAAGCP